MNIYEKLLEISNEVGVVAKGLDVGTGRSSYKAVSERDVKEAIKPLEYKHKVYSFPIATEILSNETFTWMEDTWDYTAKQLVPKQKTKRVLTIRTTFRFVNVEQPDEYMDLETIADGVDAGDKAPGKAMTYGDKYALLRAYKMLTGEDADQTHSNDIVQKPIAKATVSQVNDIVELLGADIDRSNKILAHYKVTAFKDLTLSEASQCLKQLQK